MFGNKKFKVNFVSEIDQFLQELNSKPWAKSNARIDEEQKYKRINTLRDNGQVSPAKEMLWKDF